MEQKQIVLSEDEANQLLAVLSELPIKHLSIVHAVQQFLAKKFASLVSEEEEEITEEIL